MFRDRIKHRVPVGRYAIRGRKLIRRVAAATFATAVASGLLLAVMATSAVAKSGEPSLLLLPFVVHSAEDPSYVRGGLSDMLSARFARIGGLDVIQLEDPAVATSNLEQALKLAREAGADYVLFGSFTRFGKGASLDVQCAPAAGGPAREPLREIFVHSGSIGEIIPDLDELAGKVSRFARGEDILATPAPGTGTKPGPAAAGATGVSEVAQEDISDLMDRVAALEAAMTELMNNEGEEIEVEVP
jgi:TolB-like protein